jgi:hypothetical protein
LKGNRHAWGQHQRPKKEFKDTALTSTVDANHACEDHVHFFLYNERIGVQVKSFDVSQKIFTTYLNQNLYCQVWFEYSENQAAGRLQDTNS